jgi:hypothetical protein
MGKPQKILACAALAALAILPAQRAFALDLSLDLGLSDKAHYRYQSEAGPRFTTDARLGGSLGGFYLGAELWNSSRLAASDSVVWEPAELDASLSLDYAFDALDLGLFGTLYATRADTRADAGAFLDISAPLVGDLLSLAGSLKAATDFAGLYAEARVGPELLLPLSTPISVSMNCSLGFAAFGYGGIRSSGPTHLALEPSATAYFGKSYSLSAKGGYSFDLTGGSFASYPYFELVFGISTAADGK